MRRREMIGGAAAALAGALACPAWVSRAFAQTASPAELAALSDAYRRAQRAGRPLLILVIPADQQQVWDRQMAFGELLNHGSRDAMADLALAELACATMTTVRTLVPQAGAGDPWMLLVEPDAVPAHVVRFDGPVPAHPDRWAIRDGVEIPWEEHERLEQAAIDQRIAILSGFVHRAIAPDAAAIARRAALARSHVAAADRARLETGIQRGVFDARLLGIAPAIAAEIAGSGIASAPRLRDTLAELAIQRWRTARIPGSRWAIGGGCGITIEGEPDDGVMMACGMGHTPERSARFLYWYSGS